MTRPPAPAIGLVTDFVCLVTELGHEETYALFG